LGFNKKIASGFKRALLNLSGVVPLLSCPQHQGTPLLCLGGWEKPRGLQRLVIVYYFFAKFTQTNHAQTRW